MKRAAASSTRHSSEGKSTSMFAGINRTNNSDSEASNTALHHISQSSHYRHRNMLQKLSFQGKWSSNDHDYEHLCLSDDEHDADDIELNDLGGGGRQSRLHRSLGSSAADNTFSISSITRWIVTLVLMIGMYELGMKKGSKKAVVLTQHEDDDHHPKDISDKNQQGGGGTSFTLERVQTTRKAAQNLISMLQEYYGGKEQSERMMFDSWLTPWDFGQNTTTIKNNFTGSLVEKLVDTMARALVTDDQKDFIIGIIGSSVAAGHDNCNWDSFPRQMERTFGPVWEAAGMKLIYQNGGDGGECGDDFSNQVFCIQQIVSPNIDIAHYTWTYYEAGNKGESALEMREGLARWAQMLPRQPPVHVYNTGVLSNVKKGEYELAKHMSEFGYNAFYMRSGYLNGGFDYDAAKVNGVDHFGWGHVGDGYHNVTRYGENESSTERNESLGTVMRNWHPGPLAFQFVSDTFSYIYSHAMIRALDLIASDLNSGIDPAEKWAKRKIHVKSSLPRPKFCDPLYCVVDETPRCLNFNKPTFGWWGARVEDPDDNLNPHKGEVQNWEVWQQERDIFSFVSKQDQIFFENRDDKEICRHLDACGGISATSKDSGSVVFRLPKQEVGLVVICGCCGKKVGTEMILNNTNIEISYNGQILDRSTWDLYPSEKCVRLMKQFDASAAVATTGHNYLKVKARENLTIPVNISHVITL